MSTRSYTRTRSAARPSTAELTPQNHLPTRSFGVQAKPSEQPTSQQFGHDLTTLPFGVQAKLTIGAPGDKYEQEADQVAAQVVQQINAPQSQQTGAVQREPANLEEEKKVQTKPVISQLQREAMPEEEDELQMKPLFQREAMPEEEEELQMKSLAQREAMPEEEEELQMKSLVQREAMPEEEELQTKSVVQREAMPEEEEELQTKSVVQRRSDGGGVASTNVETSINAARGKGQPLNDGVRGSMEQAFGADFSGVRVHTGSESDQLNRSVQARAFTTGQDIFFRQGEYQPENQGGQELLAHELTHVVQQTGNASNTIKKKIVSQPIDAHIHRFESNEHKAMGDQGTADSKGNPVQIKLSDGLLVTFGDMTAMAGDYFGSVAEIQQLASKPGDGYNKPHTSDEISYVLKVKVHGNQSAEKLFSDKVKQAVSKRYYTLAGKNKTHFTNPEAGDEKLSHEDKANQRDKEGNTVNNAGSYRANHTAAIVEAVKAGNKKAPKDSAILYEAFASHFLTDAYASGHMRTPRESISEYWNQKVPMFWINLKWWMAENVAQHINDHNWRGVATVQLIWEQALGTFDNILADKGIPDLTFGDVIAGAVHDYDNEKGVQADVGVEKVKLLGDGQVLDDKDRLLAAGMDTMTKVQAGLKASLKDVETAYSQGLAGETDANKVIANLKIHDGLFHAEQLWPKALPDRDPAQTNVSLNWQADTVDNLLKDARMKEAMAHFAHEKAATLASEVTFDEKYKEKAFQDGVLDKLTAAPEAVVKTFLEIINYTPGSVADLGGVGGHDTDDNAVDYYKEVIQKKGLKGLTFEQKEKLIRDVLSGATIGEEELMIVDLLKANLSHATNLIKNIGWRWIWEDLGGNDCRSFIRSCGKDFWSQQSYDAKKNEISWLVDGLTGDIAQETIIIILRTCSSGEVRKIDDEVGGWTGIGFDLDGRWDDEFNRMKN